MSTSATHRTIEAVFRMESAKLIARLTRFTRDVGAAEELAQNALLAALEQWPTAGVPDNPAAWLMQTAKRRAIDGARHLKVRDKKQDELGYTTELSKTGPDMETAVDDDVGDDLLRLVFISCHPVLSTEAQVALTLRLLAGLTTNEIARAFLVPEPTISQRIVRAKRTLTEKQVPFELPRGEERKARLTSVLAVIYLVFNEGYSATAGDDWVRPELCQDALRLARILSGLMPDEPEVHGLTALMALQASRTAARTDAKGEPVLLADQNRARWDYTLIGHGLEALEQAERIGGGQGPYTLQASIAACHARARTPDATDWRRIAELYSDLAAVTESPVVELNRSVAIGMADGPAAGLAHLDSYDMSALAGYHLLPAVRGDFLKKLGRLGEARAELLRAAELAQNDREKKLLLDRAAACVAE
ncbi:MAG: RNA polymerase sigma factor [Myxococcota bacterium]